MILLPLLSWALLQEPTPAVHQNQAAELAELERRIGLLSDELEALRLGPELEPYDYSGRRGFGPAASKVYSLHDGVSVGGYGEMLYTDRQGGPNQADFLRAVLYTGYKFDENWLFNSEIEFEHATIEDSNDGSGDTAPGEVSVEFAYLEYTHAEQLGARGGLLLVPMGLANELHEPVNFPSADRPEVEKRLLPSTWRDNGFGLFGQSEDWRWRAYLLNGLDAAGYSAAGIRGGRQQGGQAKADDLAAVLRLDYIGRPGLLAGLSAYRGGAGQNNPGFGTTQTTLFDAHLDAAVGDFRLRSVGVLGFVDDVQELNAAQGFVGSQSVGEEQQGYYLELSYNLLRLLNGDSSQTLSPFVRYEELDTQVEVPAGFSANPSNDRRFSTFGVAWQPLERIVLKADYVDADSEADDGEDLVRLAIGYVF